jgi:hypothetical protein
MSVHTSVHLEHAEIGSICVIWTYSSIFSISNNLVLFIPFRDNIVDIEIDSKVSKIPNFIKMSTTSKSAEAGLYKQGDTSVKSLFIQASSAQVRPMTPFSTTSNSFGKYYSYTI